MDPKTQQKIDKWLNGTFDTQTIEEIKRLQKENPAELEDSFYKDLKFGTG